MSLPPINWSDENSENYSLQESQPVEWENPDWSSVRGLAATIRRVLLTPKRFFVSLPLTGGLAEPLGFSLLAGTIGILATFLWQLLFEGDFSGVMPAVALSRHGNLINSPRVIIGIFLLTPFLVTFGQFYLSLCLMWATRLTGQKKNTFESAFRVAAYSQAPAVICLAPWVGAFVAAVWHFVVLITGISIKWQYSIGKSIFTLVLAIILQGVLLLLFFLLLGILGLGSLLF